MSNVEHLVLEPSAVSERISRTLLSGGRMQMLYAWRPEPTVLELRYVASQGPGRPFAVWATRPMGGATPSMANISPLLGWYEREITDLFGLSFTDHPDPSRLVLHEGAESPCPPLDPHFPAEAKLGLGGDIGGMPEMESVDVQRLPWGPVRADVVESGEFVFFYIGEHILHLHTQLFFKHRGIEKRFQGMTPKAGVVLAERVSGVGSLAHALAFCQALEAASGCAPPKRARLLRTLLAEMERLYNHLHYLGHLTETTTLKVGAAEGKLLEERAKQLNARLTGSRFLRSILAPGGLRQDLDPGDWLAPEIEKLREETAVYTATLESTGTYLDRLITTGVLERQVAYDQGATGPVERASGLDRDLRRDHPYAAYGDFPVAAPVRTAGDAHARAEVRMAEIDASFDLILHVLGELAPGEVASPCAPAPESEGLGWAESPRGSLFYAVHIDDAGRLARVKIKSPSFSNWRVFPFTVHDSNMMDYAINEASFGLTIAGCDR
ncbi:MAG: nickel-dependent hydrogenase large subunit [Caulobacteraceae bacterium]